MKAKVVTPRELAVRDIDDAISWLIEQESSDSALRFIDALERAFDHISRHPAIGSPRLANELGLTDVRTWLVTRFPFIVFYIDRPDHIDVWRVLHERRDIPDSLRPVLTDSGN